MTSPSSLLANASGVNSVTGPVLPMASKKLIRPSFPCRGPYHGADSIAASVDQSTSSVTRSRMAWTSPRPNAWYICLAVSMFCSALMFCSFCWLPAGTVGRRWRPGLSTVQSILAPAPGPGLAARPCRIANMARPARVETPHLA